MILVPPHSTKVDALSRVTLPEQKHLLLMIQNGEHSIYPTTGASKTFRDRYPTVLLAHSRKQQSVKWELAKPSAELPGTESIFQSAKKIRIKLLT
ncbi:MAG: hypothetical protein Q7T72_05145 [Bacteroidales bacterium]|nr:hypothetical protein [Bacteroidales bacterium]MDP3001720.1 hypothetical protein [Bacteroidales bacterium]